MGSFGFSRGFWETVGDFRPSVEDLGPSEVNLVDSALGDLAG